MELAKVMSPTLSVVLPNYNHATLVGRGLAALLAQDRPADEIIVVDDGSTDDSVAVIERIAATAPAIRLLRNSGNIGVIPTLQRGLQEARGTYVYFAASDDWVMPGFFARALRQLEAAPDLGLFCGEAVLVDGASNRPFAVRPAVRPRLCGGRVGPSRAERLLRTTDNWILTGSAVFRRDRVLWAGGFDPRLTTSADGLISRKIALKFGFYFEPAIVAAWAVFADSVSRKTARDVEQTKYTLDAVPALIAADADFPPWYAERFRDRWRFAACRLALQADPIEREVVLEIGPRSAAEKAQLAAILGWRNRTSARLVALAWLWYRLRPTSLLALGRTMLAMRRLRLAWRFRSGRFPGMRAANGGSGDA
jgi:glycosyltransferase involved in cell wall biosynthesis